MTAPRICNRTPEEQIGYLLKRLMHQFRHQVDERLRRNSDVSFAHLVTLDQLQQEPGIAGARLARRLLVTAQTMTGLLRRLETRRRHRTPAGSPQSSRRPLVSAAGWRGAVEQRRVRRLAGDDTDAVAAAAPGSGRTARLSRALRRTGWNPPRSVMQAEPAAERRRSETRSTP